MNETCGDESTEVSCGFVREGGLGEVTRSRSLAFSTRNNGDVVRAAAALGSDRHWAKLSTAMRHATRRSRETGVCMVDKAGNLIC
jgi:hypothetical protein